MVVAERILSALSRAPGAHNPIAARHEHNTDQSSLALLERAFPDFTNSIQGKRIVDFGCGSGYQTVALARGGADEVLGVDSNAQTLVKARASLAQVSSPHNVTFAESLPDDAAGQFDIVISQNSMEHFSDPDAALREMTRALKDNGRLLITFGPPWYAPYGSHMHFFTKVPWVNLWFSEKTVMNVRARFRQDGARRYEDVESGLNKMSVRKFERMVQNADLQTLHREYWCVKRLDFLGHVPVVREMFVNHITSILTKTPR